VSSTDNCAPPFEFQDSDQAHRSLTQDAWRRLRRHKLAMFGLGIICLLIILAVAAPVVAPYDPVEVIAQDAYQGPSIRHLMGADEYGRDIFSRVIYGARTSLAVGIISVGLSLVLGIVLGLIAGYFLGVADVLITRTMDVLYSFPAILLALVLIAILGRGLDRVMIAVGVAYTPVFARLCRGCVLAERDKVYVDAARILGAGDARVLTRHILPNVVPPLIVQVSMCMSWAILAEATLSFLGLGTQPPTPSWGIMLSKGRDLIHHSPWLSFWPGVAIMAVVFGFNVLGDGLRDALDPRLKGVG
jgi:peptide/nickel transport system permease protein